MMRFILLALGIMGLIIISDGSAWANRSRPGHSPVRPYQVYPTLTRPYNGYIFSRRNGYGTPMDRSWRNGFLRTTDFRGFNGGVVIQPAVEESFRRGRFCDGFGRCGF